MRSAGNPHWRLVGDVGGTNVRFALVDLGAPTLALKEPRSYRCDAFAGLEAAIEHHMGPGNRPDSVVVAVAGPVSEGRAHLTNRDWALSEAGLLEMGFGAARLINDYSALALSLPHLGAGDIALIGSHAPEPLRATSAVMGAGTGLGVSALVQDGDSGAVVAGEGGHAAFAPTDETEIEILTLLTAIHGRVSLERLLSGPGLAELHWALGRIRGEDREPASPEDIVRQAQFGGDRASAETLDRFCAIYGSVAGDIALIYGARGGVYLGGGIAPGIVEALRRGAFRERFEAKARFKGYMSEIATCVIVHPYAALLGAAVGIGGPHGALPR
jgi:glucokinase